MEAKFPEPVTHKTGQPITTEELGLTWQDIQAKGSYACRKAPIHADLSAPHSHERQSKNNITTYAKFCPKRDGMSATPKDGVALYKQGYMD